MAVVPLHAVYVVANFKETQLTDVRAGQPVEIEVDSFPGVTLQGPGRQPGAGQRPGIRAAAAGQRHRQLHQDRPAHPGEDRARRHRRWPAGCAPACRSSRRSTPSRTATESAPPGRRSRPPMPRATSRRQLRSPRRATTAVSAPASTIPGVPPTRRIAQDLDRGRRRDARRLHGGAQHPDHQRLAGRHPGRHRRRHRRRRLDLDRLSGRRDHRHPADRLAGARCSRCAATCWSTRCCSWSSRSPAPSRRTSSR